MLKKLVTAVLCALTITTMCAHAATTQNGIAITFDENAAYKFAAGYDSDGNIKRVQIFEDVEGSIDYAKLIGTAETSGKVKVFSWDENLVPVSDVVESISYVLDAAAFDVKNSAYADNDGTVNARTASAALENGASLYYYDSADKTGDAEEYKLAEEVILSVNGVEYEWYESDIYDCITSNVSGKTVLTDTDGDGAYDCISVKMYRSAVVDSINDAGIVYFGSKETTMTTSIIFDETKTYTVVLDGQAVSASEIREGDVISVAYDFNETRVSDSSYYDVIISRKKDKGVITEYDTEKSTYSSICI